MANWDVFKVICKVPEVMDRVRKSFEDVDTYTDGSLWIRARDWEMPVVLTELSIQYPDVLITTKCCPSTYQYFFNLTHEYCGGVRMQRISARHDS